MQEPKPYLIELCDFPGHDGAVRLLSSVAAQHKGAAFISSCGEKVKLWRQNDDGSGYRERSVVKCSSNFVRSICVLSPDKEHPDGVVLIGSSESTIQAYSASTNTLLYTLKDHTDIVCALTAGKYVTVVSGSWDKTAKVWLKQKCLMTLTGHEGAVLCILIVGGYMFTGSSDTTIKRWKAGKCEHTMSGHSDSIRHLCLLSESEFLSCGSDGTVRHWSVSGESLRTYGQHGGSVYCVAVLPDGKGFVSAGEDGKMCVWKDGRLLQTITQSVRCLCVLPTGDVICGDSSKMIHVYALNPDFNETENREQFFKELYKIDDGKKSDRTVTNKEGSSFRQAGKVVPLSEYFPQTSFITFANVNKEGMFGKLRSFNLEVLDDHHLSKNDFQLLENSVSGRNPPPQEYFQALWKVLRWPIDEKQLFPALDLLRYEILDENVCEGLCSLENGESFVDYVCRVLSSESSPVTNQTLVLRVLCNAMRHPCGRRLLVSRFDRVMGVVLRLKNESDPFVQKLQTILLVNYFVAFRREPSNVGGVTRCLRAAAELSQSVFQPEACFMLLVAIGTAIHDDDKYQKIASKMDLENFINMCQGCEVEKVYKAAQLVANWIK